MDWGKVILQSGAVLGLKIKPGKRADPAYRRGFLRGLREGALLALLSGAVMLALAIISAAWR